MTNTIEASESTAREVLKGVVDVYCPDILNPEFLAGEFVKALKAAGYSIVPTEPTREMHLAYLIVDAHENGEPTSGSIWRAMLEAFEETR